MALRLVAMEWSGGIFNLIASLSGNPWTAPYAARIENVGLWVPGQTLVNPLTGVMTWLAATTPKTYAQIKPYVVD